MSHQWRIEQTEEAWQDLLDIVRWTTQNFGERQADIYSETLALALEALESGHSAIGVKKRDDLGADIYTLHVARNGRKGRHFILFRIAQPPSATIEVLRVLHDNMDLTEHLPS